jgi:tetratricopeptide (TPR) repeat protein
MHNLARKILSGVLLAMLTNASEAQVAKKPATAADSSAAAERAAKLAEAGRCSEAMPLLRKYFPAAADKELKLKLGFDAVRCAMTLNQSDVAVDFLRLLNRAFPRAPEVLYLTVHIYSDLSLRASQELAETAPNSNEAHQLNAESLEVQSKWKEAEAEYRRILERNPRAAGIHFRMGRLLLSQPDPDGNLAEQAKQEFQQELEIDPTNAGAEYVLGELARQAQQIPEAIEHFTRATKLDAGFVDAFLGLGMALVFNKQYSEAIPPLETVEKLRPTNSTGHFYLSIAYGRMGRKADAEREASLHRKTTEEERKKAQPGSPETPEPAPPQ